MYHHLKKLMYTVRIGTPDPRFGNMLLEQFGGANGELAAAMQYSIQGLNCDHSGCKDLLMDIGTEELSHLEVVGTLARMHLKPTKTDREAAEADPLVAIAGGGGVTLGVPGGPPVLGQGERELPGRKLLSTTTTQRQPRSDRFIPSRSVRSAVSSVPAASQIAITPQPGSSRSSKRPPASIRPLRRGRSEFGSGVAWLGVLVHVLDNPGTGGRKTSEYGGPMLFKQENGAGSDKGIVGAIGAVPERGLAAEMRRSGGAEKG